jgi:hypothetical protein
VKADQYKFDSQSVRGGSKPAAGLVKDFPGRPYRFDAYREWLNAN